VSAPGAAVLSGFDPHDGALHADPYPLWAALRESQPYAELPDGAWLVTRHDGVSRLLRSRAISSVQVGGSAGAPVAQLAENGRHLMLASDAPVHARRRGAIAHRFSSAPVRTLAPLVAEHVEHRLGEVAPLLADGEVVDLVASLCNRLPMDTMCSLLGLPLADEQLLRGWTTALVDGLDPWAGPDAAIGAGAALDQVIPYLQNELAARRGQPQDDLLTALAMAPDLDADERVHNAVLLLNAGLDTSGDLLANALGLLLEQPDWWRSLVADPDGMAPLVTEEAARFDSPVQLAMRRTVETIDGIPADRGVLLGLGSANRDPAAFAAPDRFDPLRSERRHLAFGGGAHLCLGAPVARLEVTTALACLARRLPTLALVGPATWRPRLMFRGRATLVVSC
jgi:cytochrome P450